MRPVELAQHLLVIKNLFHAIITQLTRFTSDFLHHVGIMQKFALNLHKYQVTWLQPSQIAVPLRANLKNLNITIINQLMPTGQG